MRGACFYILFIAITQNTLAMGLWMEAIETIKKYVEQNEKAKLALIKALIDSQYLNAQTLQDYVKSQHYKDASYAHNLIYWALDSIQKERVVELKDNKPALTDSSGISKFLRSEDSRVVEILNSEWGSGDLRLMGDFDEALHIIARLIMAGTRGTLSDSIAQVEDDLCKGLGAFKNLSSSQVSYRRRIVIPRVFKMLEELQIVEHNRLNGNITLSQDKLQILLPNYGNEIFGMIPEIARTQIKKIEQLTKLSNEAKDVLNKIKEENALLSSKNRRMEEECKTKEDIIEQFKTISSFIERTRAIDINVNWVMTCTALNLVEASVKKKLIDLGVSREKVLNRKFEEDSKLLEKLLLEKEQRKLTSRLLFNDIYKKARGKIDHEGHVYKPSNRDCTYIVEETIDFINELFKAN
jgi:hypothetical protein